LPPCAAPRRDNLGGPGWGRAQARELQRERLPVLLDWHATHAVDTYERHRNAAIEQSQGNRNPLIDHADWAARIDFEARFG
jgi:endonuclease I